MSKLQAIKVSVSKPCHEDWDKMTLTEKGRHCSSCNKTVTDFSNYTDKELTEFFKKGQGTGCGNFSVYQLNRQLPVSYTENRSFFHKLLYGTALASWLGIAGTLSAQTNNTAPASQNDGNKKVKPPKDNTPSTKTHPKESSHPHAPGKPDPNSSKYTKGGYGISQHYIIDGKTENESGYTA